MGPWHYFKKNQEKDDQGEMPGSSQQGPAVGWEEAGSWAGSTEAVGAIVQMPQKGYTADKTAARLWSGADKAP